ncbi:unnamed protein product [Rhizophagus irregularis]|nr:unnamed protein product [Rhizophagus irregularis]CAB4421249.1 unnamed protein product [Rhizophagus irregularis]
MRSPEARFIKKQTVPVRPPNIPILLKIRGPRQLALKILRKSPCSGEKGFEAVNDICHIIGEWYNIVLECYNDGLAEDRKFDSFINCIV